MIKACKTWGFSRPLLAISLHVRGVI